ncbi:MAG: hypothetical protein WB764_01245 [Xanthobacteraceae bacterium]
MATDKEFRHKLVVIVSNIALAITDLKAALAITDLERGEVRDELKEVDGRINEIIDGLKQLSRLNQQM